MYSWRNTSLKVENSFQQQFGILGLSGLLLMGSYQSIFNQLVLQKPNVSAETLKQEFKAVVIENYQKSNAKKIKIVDLEKVYCFKKMAKPDLARKKFRNQHMQKKK